MADKNHQKDTINVEDALNRSEVFFDKNKKGIIGAVVALIVVIGGYLMYKNLYAVPREEKAQEALFRGQMLFEHNEYEKALNGDSIGFKGLLSVIDEYSGTEAANLANAYAGICYARLGKFEEAVRSFDQFSGDDQLVDPAILAAKGNCYAELGELDKAASVLMTAAKNADSQALSPIYLIQAGQIYVKLGKYDEAIKAYTMVKDKYFQSYQSVDIDKYIEQAKLMKK